MKWWAVGAITYLLSFCSLVSGQTVYKYLAEDGGISFGDQLPSNAILLETLSIIQAPLPEGAAEEANDTTRKISAAADLLKRDRTEREAALLAAERLRLEHKRLAPPKEIYGYDNYRPYYAYPRVGRHHVRRHRSGFYRPHSRSFQNTDPQRSSNSRVLIPKSKLLTP